MCRNPLAINTGRLHFSPQCVNFVAIFVNNDNMAIAVMDVAKGEFGLRVPDDLSIVSYDDTGPANWHGYQLTSYAQPLRPMVDAAVSLLMAQLEGQQPMPVHTVISGHLAVRTSARLPSATVYDRDGNVVWTPNSRSAEAAS